MDAFGGMRAVGKAWATAAKVFKPANYFKRTVVPLSGEPVPCRGAARAARRRAQKAAIKSAGRIT